MRVDARFTGIWDYLETCHAQIRVYDSHVHQGRVVRAAHAGSET